MLIFAKKDLRDKYAKCLNTFLEHLPNQDENALLLLIETLDNGINGIIKSDRAGDECFNYLQMIALEAYEAEFFKAIKDKIDEQMDQEAIKNIKNTYDVLYGEKSNFQSKREKLLKTTTILIDKTSVQPQISDDTTFDIRCNFQTLIDCTLKAQSTIILPRADAIDIISFLQQCDPQLIAALVVSENFKINTIKPNIDILHECIIAVKVLCCTIVDIALLLAPAAALGITASMVGGLSLPLTVGIVLLCLSMQLAPNKNPSQHFESSQLTNIKTQGRKDVDNILNNEQNAITAQKPLYSPMQLFNIEQLLQLIVDHIVKSYEKNQDRFKVIQPDTADLLASKMQSVYDKQPRVKGTYKGDLVNKFDKYLRELGMNIENSLPSKN